MSRPSRAFCPMTGSMGRGAGIGVRDTTPRSCPAQMLLLVLTGWLDRREGDPMTIR